MITLGTKVEFQGPAFREDRIWTEGVVTYAGTMLNEQQRIVNGYFVKTPRNLYTVYAGMRAIRIKKETK